MFLRFESHIVLVPQLAETRARLLEVCSAMANNVTVISDVGRYKPLGSIVSNTLFVIETVAPNDPAVTELNHLKKIDNGVVFFAVSDAFDSTMATSLVKNGATTLLENGCSDEMIKEAVEHGLKRVKERAFELARRERIAHAISYLTPKEKAVAICAALSADNEQIAQKLDCSVRTVEGNRVAINAKISRERARELYAQIASYLVVRDQLQLPGFEGVDLDRLLTRSRRVPS